MKKSTLFLAAITCLAICFLNCSKDEDKVESPIANPINIDDYIGVYNSKVKMNGTMEAMGQIIQLSDNEEYEDVLILKKGNASNKIIMIDDTGEEIVGTVTGSSIAFETQTVSLQELIAQGMIEAEGDEEMLEILKNTTGTLTLATTGSLSNKKNFNYKMTLSGTMYFSIPDVGIIPYKINLQGVGTAEKQTSSIAKSAKMGSKDFCLSSIIRSVKKAQLMNK